MSHKVKKPCRICGKMYTPCTDCENDKSIFHWRTVACSRECAIEYFAKVEESRNPLNDNVKIPTVKTVQKTVKPTRTRKKKNEEGEQIP